MYKNFRCSEHNKFFEFNLYKKDPINKHHWRANIEINLPSGTFSSNSIFTVIASTIQTTSGSSTETAAIRDQASIPTETPHKRRILNFGSRISLRDEDEVDEEEEYSDNWQDRNRSRSRSSSASAKDFTACSPSGCGYCGHCQD
jgi:hypothetical protein